MDDDRLTKAKNATIFREYGFVNKHEFLSVISENYFENPQLFKQKLPELFRLVNKLFEIYKK